MFAGMSPERARALAAALESGNSASAGAGVFRSWRVTASAVAAHRTGLGIEGRIDGRIYRSDEPISPPVASTMAGLWLGESGAALARFAVRDRIRDDASAGAGAIARPGSWTCAWPVATPMPPWAEVASVLRHRQFAARQSPEDKLAQPARIAGARSAAC
jgi:hypothetical protein